MYVWAFEDFDFQSIKKNQAVFQATWLFLFSTEISRV